MPWQKSTSCKADSPLCVEVAGLGMPTIEIRNSKVPNATVGFSRKEWKSFIEGVKRGEFDLQ